MDVISGSVGRTSSSEAKIALFRSLFRGRDDVYPRRFESRKTGWAGYAPACANEWVRGVCEKPRIKCAECPNRRFLPVTDDVIRRYLSGADAEGQPFVAGVYPLLQDETCFFLAVDFDKTGWRDDAAAFLETCGDLQRFRATKGESSWRLQVKLLRVLQEAALLNATEPVWSALLLAMTAQSRLRLRAVIGLLLGLLGVWIVVGSDPASSASALGAFSVVRPSMRSASASEESRWIMGQQCVVGAPSLTNSDALLNESCEYRPWRRGMISKV